MRVPPSHPVPPNQTCAYGESSLEGGLDQYLSMEDVIDSWHPPLPLPPYYVPPEITQVETSSNMAAVTPVANGAYEILCSSRSFLGPSLANLRPKIKTTAELCGASHVNIKPPCPGWKPDLESHVLKVGGGDDDDFSFSCRVGCSLWGSRARASLLGSVPRPQLCTGLACALSMRAKTVSCFV